MLRWLLLTALLIGPLLNFIADALNLGALRPEQPPGCRGVYDPQRYRQAQAFLRQSTLLGWVARGAVLALTLPFVFAGGLAWLDSLARSLASGQLSGGVLLIGLLALARAALDLPFRIWSTFVLEARHGFNRTTPGTFVRDLVTAALLATLIGGTLLAAVLLLLDRLGAAAWWICWLTLGLAGLLLQYLAPTFILPLFNRFEPLPEGEVRRAIFDCARSAAFPLAGIFVMDGSRRSTRANAFFTGFGRNRRIVLFDTLLAQHGLPELVAVLAHEMGHWRLKHIPCGIVLSLLQTGCGLFLLSRLTFDGALPAAVGIANPSLAAALVLAALLLAPLELLAGSLHLALSRRWEYAADRFAARICGTSQPLAQALKQLAAQNLANLAPHPLWVRLNSSHPPLPQRLEALTRYGTPER